MNKYLITLLLIFSLFLNIQFTVNAETEFDLLINDFYHKKNEALKLLKDVEIDLKNGSRIKACKRQKEAAKLALKANNSLIQAYKKNGDNPPIKSFEASKLIWEKLLNNC